MRRVSAAELGYLPLEVGILESSSGPGIYAMISAFLDASRKGRALTVAITAFRGGKAQKATKEWVGLWGATICHMTDLDAQEGDFKGWGRQAWDYLKESVQIADRNAAYAVAASIDLDEFERLGPKEVSKERRVFMDAYRKPYAFCSHCAMFTLGEVMRQERSNQRVHYWIEKGDDYQGQMLQFVDLVSKDKHLSSLYSIQSHRAVEKKDARLLESADILAWEWNKHVLRKEDDHHVRKSMRALLKADDMDLVGKLLVKNKTRYAVHYHGPAIEKHMRWASEWFPASSRQKGALVAQ